MADGFQAALRTVEPSTSDKANAIAAHLRVRVVLETDAQLGEWGIDSVLIGSYARHVSIHRMKDVDVFCKMVDVHDTTSPRVLLDQVHNVLARAFGADAVELQARSVKVSLPSWGGLHVDAVPARRAGDLWEIPDRSETAGWQTTNPERLGELSSLMNEAMGLLYVPTVKLLRQTRRAAGISKPGGLYIETAFYNACIHNEVSTDSQRHAYVSGTRAIANALRTRESIPDPTRPGEVFEFRASEEEWREAEDAFAHVALDAERALASPRCEAAVIFQRLLGTDTDGATVYPVPDDCSGPSEPRAIVVPGDQRISSGDQRFALDED